MAATQKQIPNTIAKTIFNRARKIPNFLTPYLAVPVKIITF